MKLDDELRASVEAAKARSVAQLLFRCARLLNEQALARIRAMTGRKIRPAHTALFPHIDLDGTRGTELARRVGISKQAVTPLVAELVEWGMLERIPDPADGRARLIRFAVGPDGQHGILEGLAMLGLLEAELADELGHGAWSQLGVTLTRLQAILDRRAAEAMPQPD